MTEENNGPKIQIDSDWKAEAQQEKERLAQQEAEAPQTGIPGKPEFPHLVNMLAMQAAVSLGGMQTPDGHSVPPDPQMARFHIDLLGVLEEKTAGNLTDDEKKNLSAVLHELRAAYVQVQSAIAAHQAEQKPKG